MLGTSRTSPALLEDGIGRAMRTLEELAVDALVVIGGDGTLGAADHLRQQGGKVVGVPKTIDNDIAGTELTFGFQTAVQIATDMIDRLHTTAESHDRVMVVEVMGRSVGHVAVHCGLAGGATATLVPEVPFDIAEICERIKRRHHHGRFASIIVVAEGAVPVPGTLHVPDRGVDEWGNRRFGGIGVIVGRAIEAGTGFDSRVTVLGHVQRGGTPTSFDRVLSSRFGVAAIDAVHDGAFGTMVALQAGKIVRVDLADVVGAGKPVDPELLEVAGVFFA